MIPRSKQPANDFSNPELLPGLYPTLFPYGCAVPEDSSRPTKVSLSQHIRYLLALEDRRFEKHHSFMFVLFNMIQRRQACLNASLMASRLYFRDIASNLPTITSHEIEPLTSLPNIHTNMPLLQIKIVAAHVIRSAHSCVLPRTQILQISTVTLLFILLGLISIWTKFCPKPFHQRTSVLKL